MEIATQYFPFKFSECVVNQQANFEHNNDFNISFKSTAISPAFKQASVALILCDTEYADFEQYIYIEIDRSKKYFVAELELNGLIGLYICDIISVINIKHTSNKYYISFDICIHGAYNGI